MQKPKHRQLLEGDQLYTLKLTRLEWLAKEMNALYGINTEDATHFTLSFDLEIENAITIYVECIEHLSDADRLEMERYIGSAKETLLKKANKLGWGKWLRYEIDVEDPIGEKKAMQRAIKRRKMLLQR